MQVRVHPHVGALDQLPELFLHPRIGQVAPRAELPGHDLGVHLWRIGQQRRNDVHHVRARVRGISRADRSPGPAGTVLRVRSARRLGLEFLVVDSIATIYHPHFSAYRRAEAAKRRDETGRRAALGRSVVGLLLRPPPERAAGIAAGCEQRRGRDHEHGYNRLNEISPRRNRRAGNGHEKVV